jgi:hypothetical protein
LRIGTRDVKPQRAVVRPLSPGSFCVEQKRKRIGDQSARAGRDQQAQRMRADQRVLDLDAILTKG